VYLSVPSTLNRRRALDEAPCVGNFGIQNNLGGRPTAKEQRFTSRRFFIDSVFLPTPPAFPGATSTNQDPSNTVALDLPLSPAAESPSHHWPRFSMRSSLPRVGIRVEKGGRELRLTEHAINPNDIEAHLTLSVISKHACFGSAPLRSPGYPRDATLLCWPVLDLRKILTSPCPPSILSIHISEHDVFLLRGLPGPHIPRPPSTAAHRLQGISLGASAPHLPHNINTHHNHLFCLLLFQCNTFRIGYPNSRRRRSPTIFFITGATCS
jgi:hypothetical protein